MIELRYHFCGQRSTASPFHSRDCGTSSPSQIHSGCGSTDHQLARRFTRGGGSLKSFNPSTLSRFNAFTLIELLIVIGIIALLLVLIAPAFTYIKGGTDVTSAAYSIKGVLDTARTYAKANNTYTWVGFFEEDVSSTTPGTGGVGRIVMEIVASKDGTNVATSGLIPSTSLLQLDKLTKIDNVHLMAFADGSGLPPGTTFDTRPPVTYNGTQYSIANIANSTTPFQYPAGSPYTFSKSIQFGPGGEARFNNSASSLQPAAEIALEPTHGATVPTSVPANRIAVQFTGVGGNVKIYRR